MTFGVRKPGHQGLGLGAITPAGNRHTHTHTRAFSGTRVTAADARAGLTRARGQMRTRGRKLGARRHQPGFITVHRE